MGFGDFNDAGLFRERENRGMYFISVLFHEKLFQWFGIGVISCVWGFGELGMGFSAFEEYGIIVELISYSNGTWAF